MMTMALLFAVAMAQPEVPFTTVDRGVLSGIDRPREVVVRSQQDWEALWKAHAPGRPAPKIDFTTQMVVAVFAGMRPTAGYEVTIAAIRAGGGELVVEYAATRPGPDRIAAQVITAPFHVVATARHEGATRFRATTVPG